MPKENIPKIEEVRELESELTPEGERGLTPEQKAQNQEYIISNLNKYIIDIHGNFFNIDEDMMVNEDERFYIGKEAVEDYDKIREEIIEMISAEKDSWEIIVGSNYRKKDHSKKVMFSAGFSSEQNERIKRVLEGESGSQGPQVNLTEINLTQMVQQRGRMGNRQNVGFFIEIPTPEDVQEATILLNERLNEDRE